MREITVSYLFQWDSWLRLWRLPYPTIRPPYHELKCFEGSRASESTGRVEALLALKAVVCDRPSVSAGTFRVAHR